MRNKMRVGSEIVLSVLGAGLAIGLAMPVQAQDCGSGNFMIDQDGNCVDLSDFGRSSGTSSRSPSSSSGSHTFPNWLIGGSQFKTQRDGRQTGFRTVDLPSFKYSVWAYDDRYLLEFRKWPYTIHSNQAEWEYTDCQTGWVYARESPLSGTSPDRVSSLNQILNSTFPGKADDMRDNCTASGITPAF